VVIDDPLPGTFECVNSDFESQSSHVKASNTKSWRISHQELRDDLEAMYDPDTFGLTKAQRMTCSDR